MNFSRYRKHHRNRPVSRSFKSVASLTAIMVFLSAFGMFFAAGSAAAQTAVDSPETVLEQLRAEESELGTKKFEYSPVKEAESVPYFPLSLGVTKPLFAGVDDITVPAFFIDPADASTTQAFTGFEVWGAAYDAINNRVLFNNGSVLLQRAADGTVTTLGTIVDGGGAAQSMVSLAWHNGVLYGTKNIATEAIWQINTSTLVATILITYPTTHDMGGLAVDPSTGFFYATDDSTTTGTRSLVRINANGTVTAIAPYPAGQTDIDALAIGNGRAYLVPDEPGQIYVFDLVGGAYLPPFANPWASGEVFSGAAWVNAAPAPAMASVSGRAVSPTGAAVSRAVITITDGASFTASTRTNNFGNFSFGGVPTGAMYTISGLAKGHTFTPLMVAVSADVTGLELTSSTKP